VLHKHTVPLVELVNQFLRENFESRWECFFVSKADSQDNRLKGQVSIELNGYESNDDRKIWRYTLYLPKLNGPIMECQDILHRLNEILDSFSNQIAIKSKINVKELSIAISLIEHQEGR
jgi:hypothetical protein